MPAAVHLPCCFALQSKRHGGYLRYVHEDGETYRQLQLNGEDAVNPFTRFDAEPSLRHEGLVHIRCRYNRKYWVARQRGDGRRWIVADAHEPEEDLTKPYCTLIKPIIGVTTDDDAAADSVMTVRFVHAGHGQPGTDTRLTFSKDGGAAACMRVVGDVIEAAEHDDDDDGDAFTVLNLARSSRRLPKFVVFKGYNGLYLSGREINGRNFLQFASRDMGDPTVAHETFYGRDGAFRVRNINLDRFWRHDGEWIVAYFTGAQVRPLEAWFRALEVKDYFAITPYYANRIFLKSITRDGLTHCLNANDMNTTITAEGRIVVEEPVLHREIDNIEYRLGEARIYDTSVLTMATTAAVNDTSTENTKRLRLIYEESEMSTWDATLELKLGYRARIRAGFPKLGLGATVNVSAEFFGAYNWGETVEKKVKHEVEYEVAVPPKTKVTVRLIATRSAVDVPFNYQQRDILAMDGEARDEPMTDGLYTGINSYNFKFQTSEEKLKERVLAPALA